MTGIACITVNTPDRRIDVGLPDGVPLADLLPTLLRHGGTDLAERGPARGGWVVRRTDGAALGVGETLRDQGVRDGDTLWIVGADEAWPEPEYDDVAEAIVAAVGRRGRVWDARATRVTSIGVAGIGLAAGIVAVVRSGPPWTMSAIVAATMAVVLLLTGVIAARFGRDASAGTALATFGAGYAFLSGLLALRTGPIGAVQLLGASVAVIVYAIVAMIGIRRPWAPMVAALVAATAGVVGSAVATVTTPVGASAVILGVFALGAGLAPALAIRLGGLLVPELIGGQFAVGARDPAALPETGSVPVDMPRVDDALARTDDVLSGLLIGVAVAVAGTAMVLAIAGGWAARTLLGAAAIVFALRARVYPAAHQRLAGLAAAVGTALPLLVVAVVSVAEPLPAAAGLGFAATVTVLAGAARTRSPVSGRLGDIVEAIGIAAIVPLVCIVLGLFAAIPGLGT